MRGRGVGTRFWRCCVERGDRHERAFIGHLQAQGLTTVRIDGVDITPAAVAETVCCDGRWCRDYCPGRPRAWQVGRSGRHSEACRETQQSWHLVLRDHRHQARPRDQSRLGPSTLSLRPTYWRRRRALPQTTSMWLLPGPTSNRRRFGLRTMPRIFEERRPLPMRQRGWLHGAFIIPSRNSTAISADGVPGAMRGGAQTIIFAWWPESARTRPPSFMTTQSQRRLPWQRCRRLCTGFRRRVLRSRTKRLGSRRAFRSRAGRPERSDMSYCRSLRISACACCLNRPRGTSTSISKAMLSLARRPRISVRLHLPRRERCLELRGRLGL